jgi:antitoxin component YwqK of YwqJK toxin-antitoxin module
LVTREETNYKDGKRNGLETIWLENGKKDYEANFKDGNIIELR